MRYGQPDTPEAREYDGDPNEPEDDLCERCEQQVGHEIHTSDPRGGRYGPFMLWLCDDCEREVGNEPR